VGLIRLDLYARFRWGEGVVLRCTFLVSRIEW
jgi:hypothetical protein